MEHLLGLYAGISVISQGLWIIAKITPTQKDDNFLGKLQRVLSPANDLIKKLIK